jgi:DNA (cytosine-5)-methyltransferase 1
MEKLTHGSLFSGIGGFDLAAEWMGWENKFHCEWNEFGQKVLHHYWPEAECFTDITKSDFKKYYGKIDILTGGFPCQPYSSAGKRKGKEDERHLWPEMLRAIREISPRFVVGENVRGLTNWNGGLVFEEVCSELESYGYQVAPVIIPACGVDAPHRRERIWFVAYAENSRYRGRLCERCSGREWELLSDKQGWCEMGCKTKGCSGKWVTSNTNGAKQTNNTGTNDREAEKIWRQNKGDVSRELSSNGNVTNSKGQRFQTNRDEREISNKKTNVEGERYKSRIELTTGDSKRIITNSTSPGGRQNNRNGKPGFNDKKSSPSYWENFPTQSPVCSGDDGLPSELDGITFSKWRNESIKAYGNAIVPQVAYQIFQAIEKTLYL